MIGGELEQDGKRNFTYEHKNGDAWAGTTAQDGRLLARRQLPVGRPDLSLRQSAAEAAAGARGREAHAAGPLGHDPRAELHLRALEPGHQEVRPRHDLRLRPRARRPGRRGQHLPRGHLQRDLSRHQPGRGRAAEALSSSSRFPAAFPATPRRSAPARSTRAASWAIRSAIRSARCSTIPI